MKLRRLQIDSYKNVRNCDLEFPPTSAFNAVIGSNGSGKSNLIEAILHILIDTYFKRSPPFDCVFEFETQRRLVAIQSRSRRLSVTVDRHAIPVEHFAARLRDGPAQVHYPELTFVYYSGECNRVRKLLRKYEQHFRKLARSPETDTHRPLFVQAANEQSAVILLALFAHGHHRVLQHVGVEAVVDVAITLRSPEDFDPTQHEPKLWNTVGAVRRIVATLEESSAAQDSVRDPKRGDKAEETPDGPGKYRERRTYRFSNDPEPRGTIQQCAQRLGRAGDNLYLALQHLGNRGLVKSVSYAIRGVHADETFTFDHLSEGEKQLLAVVGALRLTNQSENLILLDEPDTHLNPQWSWDYAEMLKHALTPHRAARSSVLMTTHDPVMISGMTREEVLVARQPSADQVAFEHPRRDPRGQGVANLLSSSEFFGLPSSLDKETQLLLDERLRLTVKEELTDEDRERLRELNVLLETTMSPGVSERDPNYVAYLRERKSGG